MPQFTSDNAAEMGRRSGDARRANSVDFDSVEAVTERQLLLVREQIRRTRTVLNDESDDYCEHCGRSGMAPHHRAQLLRSLDTLLDRERILIGIPEPGRLKPKARPQQGIIRPPPVSCTHGAVGVGE
jgi:hypothetical protein